MDPLNRTALIVRPKRRYKEWADSVATGDDDPIFDLDQARLSPTVYLIAAPPDDDLEDLIDEYAGEIFEAQLELWHLDEADWPANRSAHVFRDWFDVTLADIVSDLDPSEPLDLDPEDDDDHEEMLDALRGDSDAPLTCSWCAREIGEDDPVATVSLKGERPPQPKPGLIDLSVAGRDFVALAPSDDSEAGRQGIMAMVLFCGDDCAAAFREAWKKERGSRLS
jgi:hypothetical protein